ASASAAATEPPEAFEDCSSACSAGLSSRLFSCLLLPGLPRARRSLLAGLLRCARARLPTRLLLGARSLRAFLLCGLLARLLGAPPGLLSAARLLRALLACLRGGLLRALLARLLRGLLPARLRRLLRGFL